MVIYIKELDKNDKISFLEKYPKFLHKVIIGFVLHTKRFITKKIDEQNKIYILKSSNDKCQNKAGSKSIYEIKAIKRIVKEIENDKKTSRRKIDIILSENLKKYKEYFTGLSVLDGKGVYKEHLEDVIQEVLGNNPIELQDIYFLSNMYANSNVSVIEKIASKVKSINIITKDVKNYSILENILLEKGIVVTVLNNKKKSLKKAKIIVNLDFDGEEIKKYNIFRKACIINLNDTSIKKIQGFDGIIINGIDIELNEKDFFKRNNLLLGFKQIELFEGIRQDIRNIEITTLFGNNGEISKKERLNVQNILTNLKL
jgi:hypothetical protein